MENYIQYVGKNESDVIDFCVKNKINNTLQDLTITICGQKLEMYDIVTFDNSVLKILKRSNSYN